MNKYNDLELSILSCVLQKPKLMENNILEDKYFIKYKKIWLFMKAFYERFGNFDLTIMYSISKNKYRICEYIYWILNQEPAVSLFNEYQKLLIEKYNENKKEKWIIEKIYELSNDLYLRSINIEQFNEQLAIIYKKAEEVFKNE